MRDLKSRLLSSLRRFGDGTAAAYRNTVPLLVCFFGGALMTVGWRDDDGWITTILAFLCWSWALDLKADRAKTSEARKWADQMIHLLTQGESLEISVNHYVIKGSPETTVTVNRKEPKA